MSATNRIRPVRQSDWDGWKVLWDGYLHFYREELPDDVTRATFDRLCEGGDEMFGFVAVGDSDEDGVLGIVHALLHSSTWTTGTYCYLEDLFVARETRGTDTARQLIERVTEEARARGSEKVYWHTQEFNSPARSLYESLARDVSFRVYERPV